MNILNVHDAHDAHDHDHDYDHDEDTIKTSEITPVGAMIKMRV